MMFAMLLGAGSSVPAGYPSTQEITRRVLSGDGVWRHTDSNYYVSPDGRQPPSEQRDGRPPRAAIRTAHRLNAEAEGHFSVYGGRRPHYEDLFYMADQAYAEEVGEMENPAVGEFAIKLKRDLAPLLVDKTGVSYAELLSETKNYIADIVWGLCREGGGDEQAHLRIVEDACREGRVASISTLSHDCHVENYLRGRGIRLVDGFSEEARGVRYWDGGLSARGCIPFLKLHGSVDWFRVRTNADAATLYDERVASIPPAIYHHRVPASDGTVLESLDGRPLLLIGTFNKISEYSGGIFRDLHYGFRQAIRSVDGLVVSGYGFGDKGINSEIIDWFYGKPGRRIVIIDPQAEALPDQARPAIRNKWEDWKHAGAVTCINKRLECVDTREFLQCMDAPRAIEDCR